MRQLWTTSRTPPRLHCRLSGQPEIKRGQRTARRCANDFWIQLCESIQHAAYTGNTTGVYDGIKKAIGPTKSKIAPLKTTTGVTITDRAKQMERWVEHYSALYSRNTIITSSTLEAIKSLPVMEELDAVPTVEELSKAIDTIPTGKAPGMDGIPPEIITCGKGALLDQLYELLCQCWEEGEVPQDMRDCNIITLLKRGGQK